MAAPRATQWIALRNLAVSGHQQVRQLHVTGPATRASHVLSRERSVLNLPRGVVALRAECRQRNLDSKGTKQELVARINAHELTSSHAFSTAALPADRHETKQPTASAGVRQFNTSRSMKASRDTSTIDFAYLPDMGATDVTPVEIRVPILPDLYTFDRAAADAKLADEVLMKPQISTLSGDAVFSTMAENHDGHAMNVDFHAIAGSVTNSLQRMQAPVEQQAGLIRQLWSGMLDDLMGSKAQKRLA